MPGGGGLLSGHVGHCSTRAKGLSSHPLALTPRMDFEEIEARDGVRFSWNVWPASRQDTSNLVVPIACLYTPLKEKSDMPTIAYEPVVCKAPCRAILNPYCQIDVESKFWICPFCLQRNQFPPHYKDISLTNLPAELLPSYTTIEYTLGKPVTVPPIFFFVVDTCLEEDEIAALKESLLVTLSMLPPKSLVGLITFGTMVQVHELGFTDIPKSYVFRGSKDYSQSQIQEMLGLAPNTAGSRAPPGGMLPPSFRFLVPVDVCEFTLSQLFEQLQHDPWPVDADKRSQRATGTAASIATSLLETMYPSCGARIMIFCGGPCTVGPGMVVGCELRESIRTHHDIAAERSKYDKKATKFYEALARRAAQNGHTVDILVGCLEQVGMAEIKSMANYTGGHLVLTESFGTNIFKQSCQRIFLKDANGDLLIGFNAITDVVVSRDLKICGLIGAAISTEKRNASVSDTEIGMGGSSQWKTCSLTPRTTHAIYFEVVGAGPASPNAIGLAQFITYYQHSAGQYRLRVTTVARSVQDGASTAIQSAFDQEAAAVLMSRIAVFKAEVDDSPDVMRWVDRLLIRLCQRFGEYRKEDPTSFRLNPLFSMYPQFMFYLRRSQFMHIFNSSPDETAFFRHVLNRERVTNSLIMIQPTLTMYTLDTPPQAVLLDSVSIRPDAILLLDSFFHIVIFHGETIAQWRDQGYQDNPDFANFKTLLQAPVHDSKDLLADRFPIPMYVVCDQHGSQARFLISKLNPSTTHVTSASAYGGGDGSSQGQQIFTDDVSLQVFLDHLKKLVVTTTP